MFFGEAGKNHLLIESKIWKTKKILKSFFLADFTTLILPSRKCFPVKNKLHKINNLWSYLLRTKGVAFRIDIVKITDFGKTRNSQIIKKFMDTQIEDISNILELNFKKNLIVSNFTKKKCFFICKNSFFLDPITLPINHGIIYNSVSKYKPKIPFFSVESKVILSNW